LVVWSDVRRKMKSVSALADLAVGSDPKLSFPPHQFRTLWLVDQDQHLSHDLLNELARCHFVVICSQSGAKFQATHAFRCNKRGELELVPRPDSTALVSLSQQLPAAQSLLRSTTDTFFKVKLQDHFERKGLMRAVTTPIRRGARCVLIVGDMGSGKTALMAALSESPELSVLARHACSFELLNSLHPLAFVQNLANCLSSVTAKGCALRVL
jgi:hypothetical protein